MTDEIEELIPHAGRMCLLDRILQCDDDGITLATSSHRATGNPLATARGLRAIHLCEYGAQATAVHGGLTAMSHDGPVRPGMLVSLRDVVLACDYVSDLPGELTVEARRLHGSDSAWQYSFRILHNGLLLAEGRATIVIQPNT